MNEFLRRALFLPPQASTLATEVDHLHYFVILTTLVVSTVIGVLTVFFMVRYRRRRPNQPTPHIESPFWMESLFVIVPLSIFLLWFRIGFSQFIDLSTPPPDSMDVYVMAKQWMWKFAYPEGPNGLSVLRVPANRPVRLLITSRDVIHSFYVPAFRIKQDALPGRYTQTWFKATKVGRYPVFCAEYCGTGHSTMRAEVDVVDPDEFDKWIESERRGRVAQRDTAIAPERGAPEPTQMAAEGRRLSAVHGCLKCHSVDGTPHIGPTWLDMYHRQEKMVDGEVLTVDERYITQSMMDPKARQVQGYPLTMPSFQGRLQAPESAAIVEYIKSLRTGEPASTFDRPSEGPVYQEAPTRALGGVTP